MPLDSQELRWAGSFGREYTARHTGDVQEAEGLSFSQVGVLRSDLYREMMADLGIRRVLEVGCNRGLQLSLLEGLGSFELVGVDLQAEALRRTLCPGSHRAAARASQLPFRSGAFDLVFTSGVLIHIDPARLHMVLAEIVRCTARFVMGYEYFSDSLQEVAYRGHARLLWKDDFARRYLRQFPRLRPLRKRLLKHAAAEGGAPGLQDCCFLLERG